MDRLKTSIIATLVASTAIPAMSQTYQDPDWTDGSVPARVWTTSPTVPAIGAVLGADTYEPAVASEAGHTESDWIDTTNGTVDYITDGIDERKFRIVCEPGTAKQIDPILYVGQASPIGHRHQGSGNVNWNENSTYTTLRASPSSTCTGGPLNGVIYWEPELIAKTVKNVELGVRPQSQVFYYINGNQNQPQIRTWLRRNFGFIGGVNPANYNDTARRAEYSAGGLEYPGSPDTAAGFGGFVCTNGAGVSVTVSRVASRRKSSNGEAVTTSARHLKAEDGGDPWGGQCTGTTALPGAIILQLQAPDCWDGKNLRAPDGRGHVAYSTRTAGNEFTGLCPSGWVHVPQLTASTRWSFKDTEYLNWYFASDRMLSADAPGDVTSKDPCRQTTGWFCNGSTGHFDWIYGWKNNIVDEWQRECLGIPVRGVVPVNGPASCDTSQISKFRKMKYGGASPNAALSGGCATIGSCSNAVPGNRQRYNPLVAGSAAPSHVRGH